MSGMWEMLARVRSMFKRWFKQDASRLDEEIQAHAEFLTADYVAQGMSPTEARYAAMRELGNVTSMRQTYREQGGLPLLENTWRDIRYAFRTLIRNPAFTASCVATLTVGLGAMITVLAVVSVFLWTPLPYPDSASLVVLKELDPRNGTWPFSEPAVLDVRERSQSLIAVAAYRRDSRALTGVNEPEALACAAVTPAFFKMLGVMPIAGQTFKDDQPYAVISRQLWERKWQTDQTVVGGSIALDGQSFTISGVADMPEDLLPGVQVLLPLSPKASESRSAHDIDVVARLGSGITPGQAQAEMNNLAAFMDRANPRTNAGWGLQVVPLAESIVGPTTSRMVWMIFAAVALLWALACANVAGLQLARSVSRRHEMSTRLMLGASRGRLLAQTLTESFLLAATGAILGTVIAQFATAAIRTLGSQFFPRLAQLELDTTTIVVAIAVMLASTLLFGLAGRAPAYQPGREISRRDRGRDALIVAQVALASILLLGATLLFQSFLRLRAVDPGFNPESVLSVRVDLAKGQDNLHRTAFFRDVTQELSRLPDVESVGASNVVPFSGSGTANRFRVDGEPASEFHSAAWRAVTPGFFVTLGVPLKRGRLFSDADSNGAPEVVILSESMAKRFWPNQDPLGQRLLWGRSQNPKTIVGIVGDLRDLSVDAEPQPTMFRPFAQLSDAPMTLLVRTRQDPVHAVPDIRRQIWTVDHNVALEFQTLPQTMSDSILRPRTALLSVAAFALVALITAAFGLYGLISYRVNQRQQEIGVRLALGATASTVLWSVQRRCLQLVCAGALIGLPAAFALSSLMASLLFETPATYLPAYLAVFMVFIAVALGASFGPALRAARLDPAAALRHD